VIFSRIWIDYENSPPSEVHELLVVSFQAVSRQVIQLLPLRGMVILVFFIIMRSLRDLGKASKSKMLAPYPIPVLIPVPIPAPVPVPHT